MHALTFIYGFRGGLKYSWLCRYYSMLLYCSPLCLLLSALTSSRRSLQIQIVVVAVVVVVVVVVVDAVSSRGFFLYMDAKVVKVRNVRSTSVAPPPVCSVRLSGVGRG